MSQLAAFATSEAGKAYARIEQHYGRDPAAPLQSLDDVLAHNLRAAFLFTLGEDQETETEEPMPLKLATRDDG